MHVNINRYYRFSDYGKETLAKVIDFVENECMPAEATVRPFSPGLRRMYI